MNYPCPCCGYKTLPVPAKEAIAYICPVCFWENDIFIQSTEEPSDQNHQMTLSKARENFKKYKAVDKRFLYHGTDIYAREPKEEEKPAETPPDPPFCEVSVCEENPPLYCKPKPEKPHNKIFLPEAKNSYIIIIIK